MSAVALAMLLDAWLGEPKWLWSRLPHPAVLMGRAVNWLDRRLNDGPHQRRNGIAALAILIAGAGLIGLLIAQLGWLAEALCGAILLAQRSLVDHLRAVATGLRDSLARGRTAVAMIVSRDTGAMDASAVSRSAIESGAENFSDGVIAPLFWFALAGVPGLLIYKIVNTADSMIGYRTARHERFGWAAARMDDLLNLIPARLTALLIALPHGVRDLSAIARDARLHKSPNAGWPEAAMARVLGVALAGPRTYDGQARDFPFVNATGTRAPSPADIDAAVSALWRAWWVAMALALAAFLLGAAG